MNINIGNKIRALRKEKNISQEVLATHLGVTFQAVSKWENEIAMPDITLVPAIASFFGVSTDELFDYSLFEIEKQVEAIVDESYKYRASDPERSEKILRDGLAKYPGNDILLNCLIYVIPVPERSEEAVEICEQLIENTKYDDVKYDACRILAEAYCSMGNYELARVTIEKIPEIYFSKLSVEALLLKDEESKNAAKKQKWIAFEDLLQMMERISKDLESDGDYSEALAEAERALKLVEAMESEQSIHHFNNYVERIKTRITVLKEKA